jgi:2,5-diketo-D-gluconate reductase A
MQELYAQRRVRAIGVSNFHPDRVMDLMLHHEVKPAVNQIETHPFHQQVEAQRFLQENQIQIESWGPFAEGKNNIFQNAVLRSVAAKYNKSAAQVIVRWLTQRGLSRFQSRCARSGWRRISRSLTSSWVPRT